MTEFEFSNEAIRAFRRLYEMATAPDDRAHYRGLTEEAHRRNVRLASERGPVVFRPRPCGAFDLGHGAILPAMARKAQGLNLACAAFLGHQLGEPCRLPTHNPNGIRNALDRAIDHAERFGAFDVAAAIRAIAVRGDGHLVVRKAVQVEVI